MNTDVKILNKILTKQIQLHSKKIIHRNQAGLVPGMQRSRKITQLTTRIKGKDHTIISIDEGKAFVIQVLKKLGIEGA
jgi:hypothetical protein